MLEEKISVVIPVYNVENYVLRCLNSICQQTYSNLEIIVVNDGSTDRSLEICKKVECADSRVKVYTKKNGGLSDARNYGILKATGKYICFIDSDDFIHKNMIEILYKNINKYNAQISSIAFKMFYDGEIISESPIGDIADNVETYNSEDAIRYLFLTDKKGIPLKFGNFAWNKMYLKSLFDDVKYPVGKKMEDLGTTYKLILKAKMITYNDIPTYYYYQRVDSILHKADSQLYIDRLELSYERYKKIKKIYPKCIQNDLYMLQTILKCYPYVKNNKERADYRKIKFSIKCLSCLTNNQKIKYIIYKINSKLYTKLFKK